MDWAEATNTSINSFEFQTLSEMDAQYLRAHRIEVEYSTKEIQRESENKWT